MEPQSVTNSSVSAYQATPPFLRKPEASSADGLHDKILDLMHCGADPSEVVDLVSKHSAGSPESLEANLELAEALIKNGGAGPFEMRVFDMCSQKIIAQAAEGSKSAQNSEAGFGMSNAETRSVYSSSGRHQDRDTGRFTSSPFKDSADSMRTSTGLDAEIGKQTVLNTDDLGSDGGKLWQSPRLDMGSAGSVGVDSKVMLDVSYTPLVMSRDLVAASASAQSGAKAGYFNETYASPSPDSALGAITIEAASIVELAAEANFEFSQSRGRPQVDLVAGGKAEAALLQGVAEYQSEDLIPGPLLMKVGARAEGNLFAIGAKGEVGVTNTQNGNLKLTVGGGFSAFLGGALKGNLEVGLDDGKSLTDLAGWADKGLKDAGTWMAEQVVPVKTRARNE
ncbi:MAG: hypothetical protein CME36_11640 [unclassified Hahellaceae]|nr:hypothetical protein [Hahellaceae bacterium]|tara:strand:+ start:8416 stop:9600 length:1185 start_codon:yes stop_codon:yes gene_type:complete